MVADDWTCTIALGKSKIWEHLYFFSYDSWRSETWQIKTANIPSWWYIKHHIEMPVIAFKIYSLETKYTEDQFTFARVYKGIDLMVYMKVYINVVAHYFLYKVRNYFAAFKD